MRVCLIGCGNIGKSLAVYIDENMFGTDLVGLFDKNREKSIRLKKKLKRLKPNVAYSIEELLMFKPELVIEAASQEAVRDYAERILDESDLMILSVGALTTYKLYQTLLKKAKEKKRKIYIPSGAILGVDGVKSGSVGKIEEVTLTTIKNPKSMEQTLYLSKKGVDLGQIRKRTILYEGYAEEAVKYFPKNVNVAATLSYAGIGPQKTKVRIVVDPDVKENIHEIYVKGDFGELLTRAKNVPSPQNPRTSYLAVLSAIRTLRKISEPVDVGT